MVSCFCIKVLVVWLVVYLGILVCWFYDWLVWCVDLVLGFLYGAGWAVVIDVLVALWLWDWFGFGWLGCAFGL